jgi:shikimate kinase
VGQALSNKLGWPYVDTDALLVSESGRSIKQIVKTQGWETFRKLERDIVQQVCLQGRQVVATGGGAVLNVANVKRMKKSGKLIWLTARPETVEKRMMGDQDTAAFRPSLTARDSLSEIKETMIEREPLYRQAMDFCVRTDERKIDEISDEIVQQLIKLKPQLKETYIS